MPLSDSFQELSKEHNADLCSVQTDDDVFGPILNDDITKLPSSVAAVVNAILNEEIEAGQPTPNPIHATSHSEVPNAPATPVQISLMEFDKPSTSTDSSRKRKLDEDDEVSSFRKEILGVDDFPSP